MKASRGRGGGRRREARGAEGRRRPPRAEPQNPGPAKSSQMNDEWKMTLSSFLKGVIYASEYTVLGMF